MSSLNNAAKIACPLLLVHGTLDVRVPVAQSRELERAVRAAGGQVTLREFSGEGHRFSDPVTRKERSQLIADFVQAHNRGSAS